MNNPDIDAMIKKSTMLSKAALEDIKNTVVNLSKKQVPGDMVECGVWMGGCSAAIAQALLECNDTRVIRMFDSFDDICEPLPIDGQRMIKQVGGLKNAQGRLKAVAGFYKKRKLVGPGNAKYVYKLLTKVVGYPSNRVKIYKGWFQKTIAQYCNRIDKIALLILDCDLYVSTKICLDYLYDKLVKNGTIIIHDYNYYDGCTLAVNEHLKKNNIIADTSTYGYISWNKE